MTHNKLNKKNRTVMIKAFDKVERIVSNGMLLASAPVLVPTDTIATAILENKSPKKSFDKVSREIRKRLNRGEGRGKHFFGANL